MGSCPFSLANITATLVARREAAARCSAIIVHAGAQLLHVLDDGSGSHVGRMLGIDGHVGHGGHNCGEDDVPVLGGILVEGYLDALEHVDLGGQSVKGLLEAQGGLAAHLVASLQFEHYNVLGHVS